MAERWHCVPRPVSAEEAAIVRWLLENAAASHPPTNAFGVDRLMVVGGCGCGCASIDFRRDDAAGRSHLVADALGSHPDGRKVGLILWGDAAAIHSLEVYDFGDDASHALPPLSALRRLQP